MKKHLHNSLRALFLSLAVLLSLPMLAEEVEIDGINYELVAKIKEATVIKKSNGEYSGKVVIPESVEHEGTAYRVSSIGDYAFWGCSGLTSITIPNSVTSIGGYAFAACSGLTSIAIPNSVTNIGWAPFAGCKGLTKINVSEGNTTYDSREGCNAIIETSSNTLIMGCNTTVIPNSVTSIGDGAFDSCSGLTSVTIGNSVTSIGYQAFCYCWDLTSVTIGNSVTSIGDSAFKGCPELIDVYCYAENVPSTPSNAFDGSPITDAILHVPAGSVDRYNATAPWRGFEIIVALPPFSGEVEIDGINYELNGETKQAIVIAKSSGLYSGEVVIPESVEYGGTTYSVTSIGDGAFGECDDLTSVTIGNSVTSIGKEAFYNCSELLDVYCYAENVPSTESNAFESSPIGNATLHVPAGSVDSYEATAPWNSFGKIVALSYSEVEIDGINYELNGETKQATVIAKTSDYYSGEVAIPESVEHEGATYSVTSIGDRAFYGCNGLTSVTIGNSVTSIGKEAFYNCSELIDVYCHAENVPSTESNTFKGSPIGTATLHVPAVSVESYRTTEPWSGFETITPLIVEDLTLTDGEVFDNNIEQEVGTLTYTRTLPNMLWNPLYVPFKIPYEVLEENYEVAYINAMHSYDNDDNGEIDEMIMEIVKIKAGTLKPNHPYLIKAKNEEAKAMSIVQENVTLYPAEITTLDCSSVYTKFEITGTYQKMTSGELNGSLVISTDGAWKKLSPTSTLKPFRFYLTISSREGSPVEIEDEAMSRVRIRVMGEDDNATGIDEVKTENVKRETEIYDLSGRRVSAPAKGGVYIINGKKVIY